MRTGVAWRSCVGGLKAATNQAQTGLRERVHEFEEIGVNCQLGYNSPADMVERFPDFYWSSVSPHLQEAMTYLNVTAAGRQWIANLHNHVFCAQHDFALMGPQR